MENKLNFMNKIKVIKTDTDYKEALASVELLMSHDPDPETEEGEQLNLLTALVEDYEAKTFPETLPSPIEAIKFRMEQSDLTPADLVPYLGSRSRVSEILSGKRPLTLDMVRALEAGLDIPAKVLIQKVPLVETEFEDWEPSLVKEMESRGYFKNISVGEPTEVLKTFFSSFKMKPQMVGMLRKSTYRSSPLTDKRALSAWSVRILQKAEASGVTEKYKSGTVDLNFMQTLAKISSQENSPIAAKQFLGSYGITLVIEPHFAKTYLDGAAILINKENPVIGLTLRHDRLDNFWFTLMHELAHLSLHFNEGIELFFDEIEGIKIINLDEKEREADNLAEEALLPKAKWEVSPARLVPSVMAAKSLAKELGVHPAIIAGQIRHKGNKYVYLNKVVNEEKVRKYFPAETWKK